MKIFHIVPDISYEANGVTPVINGLSNFSIHNGDQVSVCALGAKLPDSRVVFLKANRTALFSLNEYSPDFSKYLKLAFKDFDIVHGHSLWSSANLSTGIHAKSRKAKLVTSPHGTLTKYALSRRRIIKQALWPIQRLALTRSDLLHATAESEVDDILRTGYSGPIALIPNGIEIPQLIQNSQQQNQKRVLFLSRIHPKKGLENLIRAWGCINKNYTEWELVIAGVGDSAYEASLKSLSSSLGLQNLRWIGPVYGDKKVKTYRESSLFVLPSFSENFGMAVAEAMSYGLPCIASKGTPWSALEMARAGWWTENSVDALCSALTLAFERSDLELSSMGLRGRAYVEENFSWAKIGRCFNETYNWLLGNGQRPNYIISR
ncbi:glycosyltransferase [Ferrovum sp.]|uniref:glycosyltransferase n=1 Tax=Ferrovum sp. TaxID=2609467 RepID=UPI002636D8A7|nr:glycosyltransferase [Ferrovum sp.]